MRGRPAFMPTVSRNEIGVHARRARHPQNLCEDTFKKNIFKT